MLIKRILKLLEQLTASSIPKNLSSVEVDNLLLDIKEDPDFERFFQPWELELRFIITGNGDYYIASALDNTHDDIKEKIGGHLTYPLMDGFLGSSGKLEVWGTHRYFETDDYLNNFKNTLFYRNLKELIHEIVLMS